MGPCIWFLIFNVWCRHGGIPQSAHDSSRLACWSPVARSVLPDYILIHMYIVHHCYIVFLCHTLYFHLQNVHLHILDMSKPRDVAQFAQQFCVEDKQLHVLVRLKNANLLIVLYFAMKSRLGWISVAVPVVYLTMLNLCLCFARVLSEQASPGICCRYAAYVHRGWVSVNTKLNLWMLIIPLSSCVLFLHMVNIERSFHGSPYVHYLQIWFSFLESHKWSSSGWRGFSVHLKIDFLKVLPLLNDHFIQSPISMATF